MPLLRYFIFVGGALLALLFVSDAVLPKQPLPGFLNAASSDLPLVRIHSERRWPDRIVFDTSAPVVKPATMAEVQPAAEADLAAKAQIRQAFAQIAPPEAKIGSETVAKIDASTTDRLVRKAADGSPQLKRKVAKSRPAHTLMLVAQQPRYGFFDSTW